MPRDVAVPDRDGDCGLAVVLGARRVTVPNPAENAATVREALHTLTDASFGEADDAAMHENSLNGYAALDALLAQAEAQETYGWREQHARAEAAEAERDAAVRAAEQAQEALRWYAERRNYRPASAHHDIPAGGWVEIADSFDGRGPGARARAALTGEGT